MAAPKKKRRRRLFAKGKPDEPVLDIAPLIDCSFLLIIYFILTSTQIPKDGDLSVTFPATQAESADVPPVDPMSVRLREDGVILAGAGGSEEELETNANSRDCPRLRQKLQDYKSIADASQSTPFVVVRSDDGATSQRFMDIINTLTEVGIANVTITGFREEN